MLRLKMKILLFYRNNLYQIFHILGVRKRYEAKNEVLGLFLHSEDSERALVIDQRMSKVKG